MALDPYPEYLTIEQAAVYLNVTPASVRRLLRQYGLGEFVRASIGKQVLIRRADLDSIDLGKAQPASGSAPAGRGRGAA
jgi:excisionase family DNA binding protein